MLISLKTIKRALELILKDPQGFWYNLKRRFYRAKSGIIKINGILFRIDLKLDSEMRSMYFGTYQREITNLCKKFLKKGDFFLDVGANIGYVSAFALGLVGKEGSVHSFEPVPQYAKRLQQIHIDNPNYNFYVNKVALGDREGVAKIAITNLENIGWNTMVPDFMDNGTIRQNMEVGITTLDSYLSSRNIKRLQLVKIDTEGYELPVLKGFQEYLHKAKELPILIIEINPTAYPKLNASIDELAQLMANLGYCCRDLSLSRAVSLNALKETTDVVFIPNSTTNKVAL